MILTHGANSLPRGSGGLIRLPYTLDIARFDPENLTDGKLQWYYEGDKPIVTKRNGELLVESPSTRHTSTWFTSDQFDFYYSRKIKFETTYTQVGTNDTINFYGPVGGQIISGTIGYFTMRGLWCYKVNTYTTYSCRFQYRDGYWNSSRFESAPSTIPVKVTHIFDVREPGNFSCEVFFDDTLIVKLFFDADTDRADILRFIMFNSESEREKSKMECGIAELKISYDS